MSVGAEAVAAAAEFVERDLVDEGLVPGGQVGVLDLETRRLDVVGVGTDALGRAVDEGTEFAMYCMAKPVLAAVVARLVGDGELSYDDVLGDLIPCSSSAASVTMADLLGHGVAFDVPDGLEAVLEDPAAMQKRLVEANACQLDVPLYSEVTNWAFVRSVVLALTGHQDLPSALVEVVPSLAEATPALASGSAARIGINGMPDTPGVYTPLLAERGEWFRWDLNPGFGGHLSLAGALRVLELFGGTDSGSGCLLPKVVAQAVAPGQEHDDALLGVCCRFGLGVIADMSPFCGRELGDGAYGHAGLLGMSLVAACPRAGRIFGYHIAAPLDIETLRGSVRPRLVSALLGGG